MHHDGSMVTDVPACQASFTRLSYYMYVQSCTKGESPEMDFVSIPYYFLDDIVRYAFGNRKRPSIQSSELVKYLYTHQSKYKHFTL